jgi:hypothetical protein
MNDVTRERSTGVADPPSNAELGFMAFVKRPGEYSAWAAQKRAEWEADNVIWLDGFEGGKSRWTRKRPEAEQ